MCGSSPIPWLSFISPARGLGVPNPGGADRGAPHPPYPGLGAVGRSKFPACTRMGWLFIRSRASAVCSVPYHNRMAFVTQHVDVLLPSEHEALPQSMRQNSFFYRAPIFAPSTPPRNPIRCIIRLPGYHGPLSFDTCMDILPQH